MLTEKSCFSLAYHKGMGYFHTVMNGVHTRSTRCLILTVALMVFLSAAQAYAQRYPFFNLNVEDGLVQSQATCLAQDRKGNLWIGTLGGLSRYDGKNFTSYTVRKGLLNNAVWALAADSLDNIWVGDQSGLSRFDGKTFVHYTRPQTTTRNISNTQQVQIVNDTVWWRVQGDVYFIAKGKISSFNSLAGPGFITCMLAERSAMWLARDGVLYHFYNDKCDTVKFDTRTESRQPVIYRVFRDKRGNVWVGASTGLYMVKGAALLPYSADGTQQAISQPILSVTEDKAGALWLGANSGVINVAAGQPQYYNKHNGLRDNSFLDMFTDATGNVWMASDGQGVFRFSGTQFTVLDEAMGLPSAQITAIESNKHDSLFLGTYDAGLYLFSSGRISVMPFPPTQVSAVTALCYTSDSRLWIGTRGRGLWSYQNKRFRLYDAGEYGFPSAFINSLYEDSLKRLWIGFANGGAVMEHGLFKMLPVKNTPVVSFLTIGSDSVLLATGKTKGLLLYSSGAITDFKTNTILDSSTIQCFIKKGPGLWMGSSDNGVIRYNMNTHTASVINEGNGLRSDFIYNIIADDEGNIWVGTGFGIHRINANSGLRKEPQVTFYGKAHGLSGMESNINSVLKLPDGSIWFGTTNGAVHYQPHTPMVSSSPSSIVLQSVKLTGEATIQPGYYDSIDNWYGIPYHLRLPSRKNNISFTFHAITPGSSEQLLYRYRLEGLETPWSDWSAVNSATYSALPPGKYVFHVQCYTAEGQNNPELRYSFEIITPFQKTVWFKLLLFTSCILLGILIQYIVNSAKQRRLLLVAKLRANEQNKIRAATAEDFHDEIGNKLTRINVLTNVLKNKVTLTPDSEKILQQIQDNTAQLYSGTRDILWSLKPSNDTLYEVLVRIRDFGMELFQDTDVIFSFEGIREEWREYRLSMDVSRNLIMIFKEALNNCLKYSGAKKVGIQVLLENDALQLKLADDGRGFDKNTVRKGNGINNMEIRAGRLSGQLSIDTAPGKGTTIVLGLKIPQKG
jgi:ligand-binding sensor domain-containing protein/signal transduction histidine kinase